MTRTKNKQVYIPLIPQYGFGSWLKKHAGAIGTGLGLAAGAALAPVTGGASLLAASSLGASIGGKIGGSIQATDQQKQIAEQQRKMQLQQIGQQQAAQVDQTQQNQPQFIPTFEDGGLIMYACGGTHKSSKRSFVKNVSRYRKTNGGYLPRKTKGPTIYRGGGTHEENSYGGIPLGKTALVEEGEVRQGDYIFSNRLK